ncbi:chitinase, partial [Kutzneria sp. NPDC051319]
MQQARLVAAVLAAMAVCGAAAVAEAAEVVPTGGPSVDALASNALSNNWYASAPYLMPVSNNPPDPTVVMAAT